MNNDGYQYIFHIDGSDGENGIPLPIEISERPWEWTVRVVGYSLSYLSPLKVDQPLFICCNLVSSSTFHDDQWLPSLLTITLEKSKGRFIGSDLIDNPSISLTSCADLNVTIKPKMPSSGYVVLHFHPKGC